jgi:thiol-disulfide isomerase/thioredoxin
MLRKYKFLGIITLFFCFTSMINAQKGYDIKVDIKGLSDTSIILGHYFASQSLYPDDTVLVDRAGNAEFKGDKKLDQGLYFVFMPNGTYFEILLGDDQTFEVTTDTSDYVKNLAIKGSVDNELFLDFQRYMINKQVEMKSLQKQFGDTTLSEKQKEKVKAEIENLLHEKGNKVRNLIKENPGLMVSAFLGATLEVDVPSDIKADKQAAYEYAKAHYFDNFDLSDRRLLYTPLYEGKMNNYLDNMVLQIPDSLNKEIDFIIDKAINDSAIFRYVLITLFNKYAKSQIMGMDAVQVHIADKYYIDKAWWSDEKFITDLKERVETLKPLLIGQVAPNMQLRVVPTEHFKQAANDTTLKKYPHAGSFMNIHDVDADYTVLVFWEPTCSHCKKVIPKLHTIYKNELKDQNVKVLAVCTQFGEDGKEKWVDFVNNHQLYDWINAWNPYDYKYKVVYDIRSTPQIYVLNKDKEIIGKKLGPENVPELIEAYKKIKKKE